ncbi:MAG: cation:proton antiporter regulatory subunit [bacterium]|nr:hypothetical protein [candidate division WOR-3 bacterium]MDH5684517.1 hypothetical protein [candidate division WOR-3 bacterium]
MNLLIFIIILIISFIIVRIGAIAFAMTGLEWSLATFQALSCFTGTGFTTKEAELITGHPQRRKIATFLIVLGRAGLVSMIATFANSIRPSDIMSRITIPFLHLVIPSQLLPWINLIVIVIAIYLVYIFFTRSKLARKLTEILRRNIVKREILKPVSFEELVVATGGYGVTQIEVCKESRVANKALHESNLRQQDILILAIERNGETIPNPSPDTRILEGDKLVCFGKLENIRKEVCDL